MTSQERPMDRFVPRDDAVVVLRQCSFITSRTVKRVITPRLVTLSLRAKRGNPHPGDMRHAIH
jgi:hypothetical protein